MARRKSGIGHGLKLDGMRVENLNQAQGMDAMSDNRDDESIKQSPCRAPAPQPANYALALDVVDAIEWIDQNEPKRARDVLAEVRDKLRAATPQVTAPAPQPAHAKNLAQELRRRCNTKLSLLHQSAWYEACNELEKLLAATPQLTPWNSTIQAKINIHCDIFQALVSLVSINEKGIDPFAVLHEAQFVIQEVMAGRMDFDTVTPGDDLRVPGTSEQAPQELELEQEAECGESTDRG